MAAIVSGLPVSTVFETAFQNSLDPDFSTEIEILFNVNGVGNTALVAWPNDAYPSDPMALVELLNTEFKAANSVALGIALDDPNHLAFELLPDGHLQVSSPSPFYVNTYPAHRHWSHYSASTHINLREVLD
ncbi:MAG: hypothetical protein VXW65_00700, partial [Pseudomonadota bacterium]|nr:hypothetical protein [Pseudomonadota bacterium]